MLVVLVALVILFILLMLLTLVILVILVIVVISLVGAWARIIAVVEAFLELRLVLLSLALEHWNEVLGEDLLEGLEFFLAPNNI